MRSRPKLEVFVKPAHPTAGSTVVVTARLTSSSETPIDGVEFRLSGTERRFSHDSGGDNSTRVFKTSSIVSLAARSNPEQLHVGTREVQASFPMPLYLPPTYEDPQSSIRYELTVRVDIPWWPDRVATYAIVVEPPRFRAEARGPVVFSTNTSGPQPKMPYIEVTFDPGALCRGGALSGAISVANLPAKTKTIEAELVAINDATFPASPPRAQTTRFAWHVPLVADGTETSSPFTLGIPEDVHPSFAAGLFTLGWALKFSASAGWGKGVELLVPVVIATDGPANVDPTKLRRLPPVGRERRARVWALVAQRQGLENDAESETMRARVGPVELSIELESRKDEGLCSVATLVWPPLGIDLSVRERKWSDALSRGDLAETDPAFDKRFVARARERAQSGAFLEGDLARMLAKTRSATLDDDGAVVMAIGVDTSSSSSRSSSRSRGSSPPRSRARSAASHHPLAPRTGASRGATSRPCAAAGSSPAASPFVGSAMGTSSSTSCTRGPMQASRSRRRVSTACPPR
ncbi:MAG: hypothetical protein U0271_01945 [Polyangiaceae bacterium]